MFLPGESQGQGSLAGCRLWGRTESDMAEGLSSSKYVFQFYLADPVQAAPDPTPPPSDSMKQARLGLGTALQAMQEKKALTIGPCAVLLCCGRKCALLLSHV